MGDTEGRWAALAERVAEAMTARALSQAELVRASGVSAYTVRAIMRGTPGNYRPDRLAKIARALGWSPDSIDRILEGGEPAPAEPIALESPDPLDYLLGEVVDLRADLAELRGQFAELAELVRAATAGGDDRLTRGLRRPAPAPSEGPAAKERPA